jgi:hypothetical protein
MPTSMSFWSRSNAGNGGRRGDSRGSGPSTHAWRRRRSARAATFRKDRRVNIRISSKDLEAIQKRALEEGLPYQTLMASVLHKYATRRL